MTGTGTQEDRIRRSEYQLALLGRGLLPPPFLGLNKLYEADLGLSASIFDF
jgi:hypothetical protein